MSTALSKNTPHYDSLITLEKEHVLCSLLGKTVEVYHETTDVTMQVKGTLGYDDEFECFTVNQRVNGKNVAKFGAENMERVDLVNKSIQLKSYIPR